MKHITVTVKAIEDARRIEGRIPAVFCNVEIAPPPFGKSYTPTYAELRVWGKASAFLETVKKDSKVFQPISFCPLPACLNSGNCYSLESPSRLDGETELYGYTLPSVDKIFEESYTVQHFFESAFKDSKSVETDFWESVPSDCLIAKEAEHIFKNNC